MKPDVVSVRMLPVTIQRLTPSLLGVNCSSSPSFYHIFPKGLSHDVSHLSLDTSFYPVSFNTYKQVQHPNVFHFILL